MAFSLLASAILRGNWLIAEPYAESYAAQANHYLLNHHIEDPELVKQNQMASSPMFSLPDGTVLKADTTREDFGAWLDKTAPGSIAVLQVIGATIKNDYCGWPGTNTIGSWITKADNHKNISAILMLADTPGGSADGPMALGNIIASTKKPVGVYVDGLLASAGVFWSAPAKFIMANAPTAMIGSIGTMVSFRDYTGYDAANGIKTINIVSDKSPNKNKDYYDAIAGNPQPIKDNVLNPLTEIFHSYVIQHRGSKMKDPSSGKKPLDGSMFIAEKAMELGLIDSIGSMSDAVALLKDLAGKQAKNEYKLKLV